MTEFLKLTHAEGKVRLSDPATGEVRALLPLIDTAHMLADMGYAYVTGSNGLWARQDAATHPYQRLGEQ